MPTATQQTKNGLHDATERVSEVNDRILDASKRTSAAVIDSYEKAFHTYADLQERVGEASPVEWVTTVTKAQADLTREVTKAYTSAARDLLK